MPLVTSMIRVAPPARDVTVRARAGLICLGISLALAAIGFWDLPRVAWAGEAAPASSPGRDEASLALFRDGVRDLLSGRCVKCHGGEKTNGELDLTTRDGLVKGGSLGPAIVPGDSAKSLLVRLVKHADEPAMPEGEPKLADDAIAKLSAWIDSGAMYDATLPGASGPAVAKPIPPERREFWSFQRLARPVAPAVARADWARGDLDRFVLARQEAAGLSPAAEADRRRLIRRASLDLLGLPPTPDEVEAFVTDQAPDAYERLIDRLLASPQYGERWARHWLDLARFAESHGYEQDDDRSNAYHYRDFVIRALNDDMPYDQFLRWQIAGDELAPADVEAWMATGFLAAGTHATQITANQAEKERYDELDDMISTIGTSMLGLTVGCARCHDHKYDPIGQHDYYRLAANFTTTVRSNYDLDPDPAATRRARDRWSADHAPLVAALEKFEAEELPRRVDAWLATGPAPPNPAWQTLDLETPKSSGGAKFARQPDGSWLASGPNVDHDAYTLAARGVSGVVTAVRIEALADSSLKHRGPGRAANGNFALTDLRVQIGSSDGQQPPTPLALKNPRASFEQPGLPVAAAIDSDPQSGWAVDPQFGKNQAAAFDLEQPRAITPDSVLKLTLRFDNNKQHAIGRVRVSISMAPADARPASTEPASTEPASTPGEAATAPVVPSPPAVSDDVMPLRRVGEIAAALARPAGARSAADRKLLVEQYRQGDADWRRLRRAVDEHAEPKPALVNALVCSENVPAVRLRTQGPDFYPDTQFLKRGDLAMKQGPATPGFVRVLSDASLPESVWRTPATSAASSPPRTSGNRAGLAGWITDVDHGAGHLAARVAVNRLWQHHFGRGLVATPSDFGSQGDRPTHPELLDWLASDLVRGGWRLKALHRTLMTSATYRQDSTADPAARRADPDNKLLTHFSRRRLEAEALRDAMLSVSGRLDRRMFGPGSLDESQRRRSVYFTIKRSRLIPWMVSFDCPEPLQGVGARCTTTVAPQALALMNNDTVRDCAGQLARRLQAGREQGVAERVGQAYRLALCRPPEPGEAALAAEFIGQQTARYMAAGSKDPAASAWVDYCQMLLSLNEFAYVD